MSISGRAQTTVSAWQGADRTDGASGLAHVASLAFLATRIAPPLAFPLSLAGGVALARAGSEASIRCAYGVAAAAVIETIAIAGPNRLGGPVTQAATAPLLGRMGMRDRAAWQRVLACAGIRFSYNLFTTVFFILVLAGGLDRYAQAYDRIAGALSLPEGPAASLWLTAAALLGWALVAASIQVVTFERALKVWPAASTAAAKHVPRRVDVLPKRFDPRAVALTASLGFSILLLPVSWPVLSASALWLGGVWALSRAERAPLRAGVSLAVLLALLAFVFAVIGAQGAPKSLELAARAGLLVLVATWLRAATGDRGFREVARRALWRLRRIPAAAETGAVLGELGTQIGVGSAARDLAVVARAGRRTPRGALEAILVWVATEADRFRPLAVSDRLSLRAGPLDVLLVLSASLPLAGLLA